MNKRYFIAFVLLLVLQTFCYAMSRRNKVINRIREIPTVKDVVDYVRQKDFEEIYKVWVEMDDGTKIILTGCRLKKNKLTFTYIYRFGDIAPLRYVYDCQSEKVELLYYNHFYYDYDKGIINELRDIVQNKNAEYLLLNYVEVKKILSKLPVVDSSVLSYWKMYDNFGERKTNEEYYEMVKNDFCYEYNRMIYGFYAVKAEDASWAEFKHYKDND